MKYELRKPCSNCPFRTDIKPYLSGPGRAWEIVGALQKGSFPCHKTVDYPDVDIPNEIEDDEDNPDDRIPGPGEQFCAGALIMMCKEGALGQLPRIAMRLEVLDPEKLDMDAPVFQNSNAFVQAQARADTDEEEEEFEPCHVCGPNCEQPAGFAIGGAVVENSCEEELPTCSGCSEACCYSCSVECEGDRKCHDCLEDEEDEGDS